MLYRRNRLTVKATTILLPLPLAINAIKLITYQAGTGMVNIVRQILPPPSAATSQ